VEELARDYKGRLKVAKLDIDTHQAVPQKFGVRSIPTLLLFKGGRVVDTIIGAVPKSKLVDAVKKVV
jgi:thioredoxin 1